MTSPLFTLLSPYATNFNKTPLPRLNNPIAEIHGIVEKLPNGNKLVQYVPSDHPNSWNRRNNKKLDIRSYQCCHEPYDETEMLYTLNPQNFRTFDRFDKNAPGIMSLGCSHTYGIGVRDTETWPYNLAKSLKLPNWNLGCGAQSVDWCIWVARTFFSSGYIPKAVAVWWPEITRTILAVEKAKSGVNDRTLSYLTDEDYAFYSDVIPISANDPYDKDVPESILPAKGHFSKSSVQFLIEFITKREYLIQMCKLHNVPIVEFHGSNNWDTNGDFSTELFNRTIYHIPHVELSPTMSWEEYDLRDHETQTTLSDYDPAVFLESARDGMHCSGTFMKEVAKRFEIKFRENYKDFE